MDPSYNTRSLKNIYHLQANRFRLVFFVPTGMDRSIHD